MGYTILILIKQKGAKMRTNKPLSIRSVRGMNQMPQMALAKVIGISQSKLSGIERGYTSPSVDEKRRIAAALGVRIDQVAWPAPKDK
jgi:DNA-binding XRE family transcriptional regulator